MRFIIFIDKPRKISYNVSMEKISDCTNWQLFMQYLATWYDVIVMQ